MIPGGYGEFIPGLEKKEYLIPYVKKALLDYFVEQGHPFPKCFMAIKYREKVVAGFYYQIDVRTSNGFYRVDLFEDLPAHGKEIKSMGVTTIPNSSQVY